MPKHFTSHKTAILTYLLPSPRASARSPNSSEHSERSTGEADLNLSLSIAYGVPDNACVMGCLTNTIRVFLEQLVWLVLLLSATSPVFCGVPKTLVAFWGALRGSVRKILPASCLFIIPNTIRRWVVIANSLPSLQGGVGGIPPPASKLSGVPDNARGVMGCS